MTETKNLKLKTYETTTDSQELVARYIDNTSDNFQKIDEFCKTDTTLSVEGGIADAKTVGDNVSQLKDDIIELEKEVYLPLIVDKTLLLKNKGSILLEGTLSNTYESNLGYSDLFRATTGVILKYKTRVYANRLIIATYDDDMNLVNSVVGDGSFVEDVYTFTENDKYFRISGFTNSMYYTNGYFTCESYPTVIKNILDTLEEIPEQVDEKDEKIKSEVKNIITNETDIITNETDEKIDLTVKNISLGISSHIPLVWEKGYINDSGVISSGGIMITRNATLLTENAIINIPSYITVYAYEYTIDDAFNRKFVVDSGEFVVTPQCMYRFSVRVTGTSSAEITDAEKVVIAYNSNKLQTTKRIESLESYVMPLKGKKWVAMGDSLTDSGTLDIDILDIKTNYTDIVSKRLGLNLINLGKGGTGYWRGSHKNDGTASHKAFYQQVSQIPLDANVVTIFGSFNDMGTDSYDGLYDVRGYKILTREKLAQSGYSQQIIDSIEYTVDECIKKTIDDVLLRVPNAMVGIILPTPWNAMLIDESDTAIYEEYCNLVKKIAHSRSIPVLDLFHESNLHPSNPVFASKYYKIEESGAQDTVHPNHYGHSRISGKIANFVKELAEYAEIP